MLIDKRSLYHMWMRIRPIKSWYLLAICVLSAAIGVVGLRNNYITMTHLRQAVYTADQNNGDVEKSLQALRRHVNAHMNTALASDNGVYPPIQLKYTYQRLVTAEQDRVNQVNAQVYTTAQHYCEALYPSNVSISGGPRVPCIEQYVKDHGTSAQTIPDAIYKFDFASPSWSPDLAGWGVAAAGLFLFLAVVRFLLGMWLKAVTD